MAQLKNAPNHLRIIAGKWRSRKISFTDKADIRPTLDRIKETLFNWLQGSVNEARCLDLYAGSGALGFEALSRGADSVIFVDQSHETLQHIQEQLQMLEATNGQCQNLSLPRDLTRLNRPFDIIFIDPPYNADLLNQTLKALSESELIHDKTLIYGEAEKRYDVVIPDNFEISRQKTSRHIQYFLLKIIGPQT
jgi:16S rRNA (guanine966-N2)-methyltransferase